MHGSPRLERRGHGPSLRRMKLGSLKVFRSKFVYNEINESWKFPLHLHRRRKEKERREAVQIVTQHV